MRLAKRVAACLAIPAASVGAAAVADVVARVWCSAFRLFDIFCE
jgi:hypothetical protein